MATADLVLRATMSPARPVSPSTPTAMQGYALVQRLVADWEPPALPDSALEVIAQEWETFHDTLLNHVEDHRPAKCTGLLFGDDCEWCKKFYGDAKHGANMKLELLAFSLADKINLKEVDEDDGFDPDAYGYQPW